MISFRNLYRLSPKGTDGSSFTGTPKECTATAKQKKPSLSELGPVADRSAWNAGANCVQVAVIAG
jgi:hypothetical protein